jgi:L-histidine N-alpha-methyltransferase
MHLESTLAQVVPIRALDLDVRVDAGEHIQTESCAKYTIEDVDRLLRDAGLVRVRTWVDPDGRFAVHLARDVLLGRHATR